MYIFQRVHAVQIKQSSPSFVKGRATLSYNTLYTYQHPRHVSQTGAIHVSSRFYSHLCLKKKL